MSKIQIKVNDIKINNVNDTAKYFIIIPQNIFIVCCFMKTILYEPKNFYMSVASRMKQTIRVNNVDFV